MGTDAPIDVAQFGGSGFAELDDVRAAAAKGGHPWWTLSQLSDESAVELDIRAAPSARGHQHDIDGIFAMLRAHVATGGYAVGRRARRRHRAPRGGAAGRLRHPRRHAGTG